MTLLAGHLVVSSLGLALLTLLAWGVMRLCRRDPVQAYRFLVVILVLALALPFGQVLVQGRFADLATQETMDLTAGSPVEQHEKEPAPVAHVDALEVGDAFTSFDDGAGQRALLAALGLAPPAFPEPPTIEAGDPFSMTPVASVVPPARPWVRRLSEDLAPWVVLWALGAAVLAALFACRLLRTRRILRESLAVRDGPVHRAFKRLAREYGLDRRVTLRASVKVSGPCCTGLRSAVLLVPLRDAEAPPAPALIWGLRHELTHLGRGDGLTLALQTVLTTLFWFHPAVWWFSSQVDRLRELSCDQLVVLHTGRRKSYALALVDYARPLAAQGAPAGLVPWFGSKSQLKRRIEMLALSTTRPSALRRSLQALGILAVLTLLLGGQVLAAGVWLPQEEAPGPVLEPPHPEDMSTPSIDGEDTAVFIKDLVIPEPTVSDLTACPDRIGVVLKHPSPQACAPYGVDPDHALEVVSVEAGWPAERAGIRPGDLFLGFGDDTPLTHDALVDRIQKNRGGRLRLEVGRGGKVIQVLVDLATPVAPTSPNDRDVEALERQREAIERRREAIERRREDLEERIARLEEQIDEERARLEESAERDAERREALMERSLAKIEEQMERSAERIARKKEQIEEKMASLDDLPSKEAREQARRELEAAARRLEDAMRKNRAKLEKKARSLRQRFEQEMRKRLHEVQQSARELQTRARAERRAVEQEARRLQMEARKLEAEARERARLSLPRPPRPPRVMGLGGPIPAPAPPERRPLDETVERHDGTVMTLDELFRRRRAEKRSKGSSRRRAETLERMEAELRRHLDTKLPDAVKRRGGRDLDGWIRRAIETIGKDGDVHLDLHPTIQGNTIYIIVNPHVDAEVLERKLLAPRPSRKPEPRRKSKRRKPGKKPAPKLTFQGHLIRAVAEAAADMGPVQVPLTRIDGPVREVLRSLLDRIDRLEERMARMEEGIRP